LSSAELPITNIYHFPVSVFGDPMAFPIKICVGCSEEFELRPGKPGFANRCPACSEPEASATSENAARGTDKELNQERKKAMRDLLYRKDS
jgi:hypothetical protein